MSITKIDSGDIVIGKAVTKFVRQALDNRELSTGSD